jgi:hypothetical protein
MVEVAPGDYTEIRPPVGESWTVQNIYSPDVSSLYVSDGVHDILIAEMDSDAPPSMGFMGGFVFQLVNGHYLKVYNDDVASHSIGYSGKFALPETEIVYGIVSLANLETEEIKPLAGGYIIQNIYLGDNADIEFSTGTYDVLINRNPQTTSILCGNYECNTSRYLQITNTSGDSSIFGYDGFRL